MAWIKDFWKRLFDKNEWRSMFGNFQTYQNDDGSYSTKYVPSDYSAYSSVLGDSSAASYDQETPLIDYLAGLFNSAGQEADAVRDYNAQQAKLQWQQQRDLRRSYYQDVAYSLEQAGFNPILAATNLQGPGSVSLASASSPMGNSDTAADMINSISNLIVAITQLLPTSAMKTIVNGNKTSEVISQTWKGK